MQDNLWRAAFQAVCDDPALYGLAVPDCGPTTLPACMQLGADETPLQYCPQVRGTYQQDGLAKQITIIAAREKRAVTGTPVVCRDGTLLLFQA